jgi:hypothetical protein
MVSGFSFHFDKEKCDTLQFEEGVLVQAPEGV